VVTPGGDDTLKKLPTLELPPRLDGKTVLDVGAWDGFYSFEAERRGAERVLAIDEFVWIGKTWGSKEGFDLARRALGSRVEDRIMSVYDLSPENPGTFDIVLFLGVLYHLRHPILALERLFSVTRELLVLETHVHLRHRQPMLEFYPGDEVLGDSSNWFGPNPAAVAAMLRSVGFRRVVMVSGPASFPFRFARAARNLIARPKSQRYGLHHGRVVFHAFP